MHEMNSFSITSNLYLYNYAGTNKAMNLPSKLFPSKGPIDDDSEDDLSDISERSREEDTSEPTPHKRSMFIDPKFADDHKNRSPSGSARTGAPGFFTPEVAGGSSVHQNASSGDSDTGNPDTSSPGWNTQQQTNKSPSPPRPVVQARRLEKSDSDDTTSATDSLPVKQSAAETFYSPDESVDDDNDTDDQKSNSLQRAGQNSNNQTISALPRSLDAPQTQNQTHDEENEDEDEDDDTASEASSTENQHLPLPTGKMALGETQIYTARFYTV